jgi:hypothetical protein
VSDVLNFIIWLQKMNMETETFIFPASWKTDSWVTDQEAMLVCMKRMARSVTSVTFQHGWKKEVCATVLEETAICFSNLVSIDLHEMGHSEYDHAAFNRGLSFLVQKRDLRKVVARDTTITDETLKIFAERCPDLQHFDICNCYYPLSDASILAVVQCCCRSLLHLDVEGTQVAAGTVSFVGQHCPLLQHLSICRTPASTSGCAALGLGCPDLVYLGCTTTGADMLALATSRPNLLALIPHTLGRVTSASKRW